MVCPFLFPSSGSPSLLIFLLSSPLLSFPFFHLVFSSAFPIYPLSPHVLYHRLPALRSLRSLPLSIYFTTRLCIALSIFLCLCLCLSFYVCLCICVSQSF